VASGYAAPSPACAKLARWRRRAARVVARRPLAPRQFPHLSQLPFRVIRDPHSAHVGASPTTVANGKACCASASVGRNVCVSPTSVAGSTLDGYRAGIAGLAKLPSMGLDRASGLAHFHSLGNDTAKWTWTVAGCWPTHPERYRPFTIQPIVRSWLRSSCGRPTP
jgi:hypothetical protein